MRKVLTGAAVFVIGMACGLIFTYGPVHAQEPVKEGDIMAKLNEISKGQSEIMAAISSIKQDMQILRIRITQNQ